jgi:hypothetical protein
MNDCLTSGNGDGDDAKIHVVTNATNNNHSLTIQVQLSEWIIQNCFNNNTLVQVILQVKKLCIDDTITYLTTSSLHTTMNTKFVEFSVELQDGIYPIRLMPFLSTNNNNTALGNFIVPLCSTTCIVDIIDAIRADSNCFCIVLNQSIGIHHPTMIAEGEDVTFTLQLSGKKAWFDSLQKQQQPLKTITCSALTMLSCIVTNNNYQDVEDLTKKWRIVEPHTGRVIFYLLGHQQIIRLSLEFDIDDIVEIKITSPSLFITAALREAISRRLVGLTIIDGPSLIQQRKMIHRTMILKRIISARDEMVVLQQQQQQQQNSTTNQTIQEVLNVYCGIRKDC